MRVKGPIDSDQYLTDGALTWEVPYSVFSLNILLCCAIAGERGEKKASKDDGNPILFSRVPKMMVCDVEIHIETIRFQVNRLR